MNIEFYVILMLVQLIFDLEQLPVPVSEERMKDLLEVQ